MAFGLIVGGIAVAGVALWRRWRRWNPVQGTSDEAKAAEARLWATRLNEQGGGGL
jgi:hypothetical protein